MAIVSQESARLWVGRLDASDAPFIRGSGAVYRFPGRNYGNVEGIDWLSEDTLIAVSDRTQKDQPAMCAQKDQSIHVFRIPGGAASFGSLTLAQDNRGSDACRMPRRQRARDCAEAGDGRYRERKGQGVER